MFHAQRAGSDGEEEASMKEKRREEEKGGESWRRASFRGRSLVVQGLLVKDKGIFSPPPFLGKISLYPLTFP